MLVIMLTIRIAITKDVQMITIRRQFRLRSAGKVPQRILSALFKQWECWTTAALLRHRWPRLKERELSRSQ